MSWPGTPEPIRATEDAVTPSRWRGGHIRPRVKGHYNLVETSSSAASIPARRKGTQ